MRLILIRACLAGLTIIARPTTAPTAPEQVVEAGLVVVVDAEGKVRAGGHVPQEFSVGELKKRIPGIDLSDGVTNDGAGDPEQWDRLLDALTIILPRLRQGEAEIVGSRVWISGVLESGFSAESIRGGIRLALGTAWEVEIGLEEAPPAAAVRFEKTADGYEISGILPTGIDPPEALSLLGGRQGSDTTGGMTGGGEGDAAAWGIALARLGEVVVRYVDAAGRITEGVVEIEGTLLPGYEAVGLGAWLRQQLGDGWKVSLAGQELPARDGDIRRDVATGSAELMRRGRWLPVFEFEPAPGTCADQTRSVESRGQVAFVIGKSQVDPKAQSFLDQLAGIAIRCLNDGGLTLEIGGYTDNVGNDADNLALSQRRAMAVLLELMDRGIRADSMTAIGHGEIRPLKENTTEDGRAKNRRISFDWSE
jgi:OOP family OmpA-OmpF porin